MGLLIFHKHTCNHPHIVQYIHTYSDKQYHPARLFLHKLNKSLVSAYVSVQIDDLTLHPHIPPIIINNNIINTTINKLLATIMDTNQIHHRAIIIILLSSEKIIISCLGHIHIHNDYIMHVHIHT